MNSIMTPEKVSLLTNLKQVKGLSIWQRLNMEQGIKQYGNTITTIEKLREKRIHENKYNI